MCVCVCVCVYAYIYVCVCVCVCMGMHGCVRACVHACECLLDVMQKQVTAISTEDNADAYYHYCHKQTKNLNFLTE